MKITIPHDKWDADLRVMRSRHSDFAGAKKPLDGATEFDASDLLVTQEELEAFLLKDVLIDESVTYIQMPFSQLDNLVTVSMPDAKYIDEEGVEQRRVWQEYAPFHNVSNDGLEVLVRCVHVQYGATSANGTNDAELRAWFAEFGSVIARPTYLALMQTPEWVVPGAP